MKTACSRCGWCGTRTALSRLSRRGMGRARMGFARAVREADARRFPGGAFVDHHPAQARCLPRSLRRISIPKRWRATRAKKLESLMQNEGIVRNRCQDRKLGQQCQGLSGDSGFLRSTCGISSTASRVQTRFKTIGQVPARNAHCRGDVEGPAQARLQFLRADHRLRLHAGLRAGERPSDRLPPPRSRWRRSPSGADGARQAPPRAWQRMLSGRRLDLLDPSPLDIEIEDIAHGLARVARWNGQTKGPHAFSVAQHSLLVETLSVKLEPDARPQRAAGRPPPRRAGICDRRHDLALQGGARPRLQGLRDCGCSAPSTCASDCRPRHRKSSARSSRRQTGSRPIWKPPSLRDFRSKRRRASSGGRSFPKDAKAPFAAPETACSR